MIRIERPGNILSFPNFVPLNSKTTATQLFHFWEIPPADQIQTLASSYQILARAEKPDFKLLDQVSALLKKSPDTVTRSSENIYLLSRLVSVFPEPSQDDSYVASDDAFLPPENLPDMNWGSNLEWKNTIKPFDPLLLDDFGIPYSITGHESVRTNGQRWSIHRVEQYPGDWLRVVLSTYMYLQAPSSSGKIAWKALWMTKDQYDQLQMSLQAFYAFSLHRPVEKLHHPFVSNDDLLLEAAFNRKQKDLPSLSWASFRGFTNKSGANPDRIAAYQMPSGRFRMAAISGVGDTGDLAAETIRATLEGHVWPRELDLSTAHEAAVWTNFLEQIQATAGLSLVSEEADGSLAIATVGYDCETIVFALNDDLTTDILYTSARANRLQKERLPLTLTADDRILEDEHLVRLKDLNVTEPGLGAMVFPQVFLDSVPLPPGKKYVVLVVNKGVTGNFIRNSEIADFFRGPIDLPAWRDALLFETLFRSRLARMQETSEGDNPMQVTEERRDKALQQTVTVARMDPPAGFEKDKFLNHWIVKNGYILKPDFDSYLMAGVHLIPTDNMLTSNVLGRMKSGSISFGIALLTR